MKMKKTSAMKAKNAESLKKNSEIPKIQKPLTKTKLKEQKRKDKKRQEKVAENVTQKLVKTIGIEKIAAQLRGVAEQIASGSLSLATLKTDATLYIKLATQLLKHPDTPFFAGAVAVKVVIHVVQLSVSSTQDMMSAGASEMEAEVSQLAQKSDRLSLNTTLVLAFAREAAKRLMPMDKLATHCLAFFDVLFRKYPRICLPIKDELDEVLQQWLNAAPSSMLCNRLHSNTVASDAGMTAGKKSKTNGAAADESKNKSSSGFLHIGGGSSQHISRNTMEGEGFDSQALAARVWGALPVKNPASGHSDVATGLATASGLQLCSLSLTLQHLLDALLEHVTTLDTFAALPTLCQAFDGCKKLKLTKIDGVGNSGVAMMEVGVCQSLSLLKWMAQLVTSGILLLQPAVVVYPLLRVLQVSCKQLSHHRSPELAHLTTLWPAMQHAALQTLQAYIECMGSCGSELHHSIIAQLGATLSAVHTLDTARVDPNVARNKANTEGEDLASDVVAQQRTVSLIYSCLATLLEATQSRLEVPLSVVQVLVSDVSVREEVVRLNTLQKGALASLPIRKKSKKKGYTTAPLKMAKSKTGTVDQEALASALAAFGNTSRCQSLAILGSAARLVVAISNNKTEANAKNMSLLHAWLLPQLELFSLRYSGLGSASALPSISGRVDMTVLLSCPGLFVQYIRLLTSLCLTLHPHAPPPTHAAMALLNAMRRRLQHKQIVGACLEGLERMRGLLLNPQVETYLRRVREADQQSKENEQIINSSQESNEEQSKIDSGDEAMEEDEESDNEEEEVAEIEDSDSELEAKDKESPEKDDVDMDDNNDSAVCINDDNMDDTNGSIDNEDDSARSDDIVCIGEPETIDVDDSDSDDSSVECIEEDSASPSQESNKRKRGESEEDGPIQAAKAPGLTEEQEAFLREEQELLAELDDE